jgi:two-component system cell cycle response regulator
MADSILVIDDSPDIHALVRVRLGNEHMQILCACDGASGLAAARELKPDLILLDVDMPGRDGFAVCEDLKADPTTCGIPVIFLSGVTTMSERVRGLEIGASDYITKPFDPAELQARVHAALRMRDQVLQLSKMAMVDSLTGLWNRAYLETRLAIELSSSRRSGEPLSCIMADIDCFKAINDYYGHSGGDEVLKAIAELFSQNCRDEDSVCRYGGEEFTILLPNMALNHAGDVAERMRSAVETHEFHCGSLPMKVTCSFGVANLREPIPPSIIERADQALYGAKLSGRNRVEICHEEGHSPALAAL